MSLRTALDFSLRLVGDGSDTNVVTSFLTGPFVFKPASGGEIAPAFSLSQSLPSALTNLAADNGATVSASIGLLGAITITLSPAPGNGEVLNVTGTMLFA